MKSKWYSTENRSSASAEAGALRQIKEKIDPPPPIRLQQGAQGEHRKLKFSART